MQDIKALKNLLDEKVRLYNQPSFIKGDPIVVPHRFSKPQDIEIAGLFAAVLAWGNRTSIINSTNKIMQWMDDAPHDFVVNHQDTDLKKMLSFAHRTFNATDLLYFIYFLQYHYSKYKSLEDAFVPEASYEHETVEQALILFHNYFFSIEPSGKNKKTYSHTGAQICVQRINMYLRWMVRTDNHGVDFGIWKKISPRQLVCPLDVHVGRVAFRLRLIRNEKSDWQNALSLTQSLRELNPEDPAVYDYALFGLGAEERF